MPIAYTSTPVRETSDEYLMPARRRSYTPRNSRTGRPKTLRRTYAQISRSRRHSRRLDRLYLELHLLELSSLARKTVALFSKRRRSHRHLCFARAGVWELSPAHGTSAGRHDLGAKESRRRDSHAENAKGSVGVRRGSARRVQLVSSSVAHAARLPDVRRAAAHLDALADQRLELHAPRRFPCDRWTCRQRHRRSSQLELVGLFRCIHGRQSGRLHADLAPGRPGHRQGRQAADRRSAQWVALTDGLTGEVDFILSGNPTNRPSHACRVSRAVRPLVKSRNSAFLCKHTTNQTTERLFVTQRL